MISIEEALAAVLKHAAPLAPQRVPLSQSAGRVLAEAVVSDIDSPPHDKALMDGYAVRCEDLADGTAELEILEEITAGAVPTRPLSSGQTSRIMTGAPLPSGADAVVVVEHSRLLAEDRVRLEESETFAGKNLMRKAELIRRGETVLSPGRPLSPAETGLMAEVGHSQAAVQPKPRVAVLPTGNELVAADVAPAAGQIRNSNGPMLAAFARQAGADAVELGVGRDDLDALKTLAEEGLQNDVLLLSGGVSAGVLDLAPRALQELGVREVFHHVKIKPGKPLWFGVAPNGALVFGLPGNPVSSLVGFAVFVRPALDKLAGQPTAQPQQAALAHDYSMKGARPTYFPAKCEEGKVELLPWKGSADLRTVANSDVLAFFPAGPREYAAGESIVVLPLRF